METERLPRPFALAGLRFRFTLRALFVVVTLFAGFCYIWVIRPSNVAGRFLDAVHREDYEAADRLFVNEDYKFFADWADERWAFQADCEVRPWTIGQLLSGRRRVDVHMTYFEFDSNAVRQAQLTATPFGISVPRLTTVQYESRIIDAVRSTVPSTPRR